MIIFELDTDWGLDRTITWLGNTTVTDADMDERDGIYEQLTAREVFLCD